MSPNPFCSRFNNDVRSVLQWFKEVSTRTKSIVYNERQVMFFCEIGEFFKIRDIQSRITDGFKINSLCIVINKFGKVFNVIAISKTHFNTKTLKRNLELIVS